jgi:hypothetical protein
MDQGSCENKNFRLQTRNNGLGAAGRPDIDGQRKVGQNTTAAVKDIGWQQ